MCDPETKCQIKFLTTPTVTGAEVVFEENFWFLKVTGTDFGGAEDAVLLQVAGANQTF